MSAPWGNPPPLPGPPRQPASTFTVPLSACCGALPGDVCGCAAWEAEVLAAFADPIRMAPPQRWQVTGDVVSVEVPS